MIRKGRGQSRETGGGPCKKYRLNGAKRIDEESQHRRRKGGEEKEKVKKVGKKGREGARPTGYSEGANSGIRR